jgi:trk system potassium uptake protein TrkA
MLKVAVLGLGRFGQRLALDLARSGVEVLAADKRGDLVAEVSDDVSQAVQMDCTDEEALREQELDRMEVIVVSIGENFEAAVRTTFFAARMKKARGGVRPRVIARAQTSEQAEILTLIGADQVIQPENEAARILARKLAFPNIEDYLPLDKQYSILPIKAPESFVGRTPAELRLGDRYGVNLISIKRLAEGANAADEHAPRQTIPVPLEDDPIREGDILVLLGPNTALAELAKG